MAIKEELAGIVGADNVSDDSETLKPYSKDYSLSAPSMPSYVVKPKNVNEIQKIVQLANKNKLPIVPCSSGIHFNGDTIPVKSGIVLDLSGMNKILAIDDRNRMVRVEAGVTWEQLQPELAKHDMMAIAPLLPHHQKSALISHLERDPAVIPKFEYTDALVTVEVVLPEGEIFKTGSAAVPGFPDKSFSDGVNPSGPGNMMWTRMLQGAQGTLGVVTWGQFKIEYRPKINKTYFMSFNSVEDAVKAVFKIQRRMIGEECLILNNTNLAAIFTNKWPKDYQSLKDALPAWTLFYTVAGYEYFPEERVSSYIKDITDITQRLGVEAVKAAGGISANEILKAVQKPSGEPYWKLRHKGACQDIFYLTLYDKLEGQIGVMNDLAEKAGYPASDVGVYIQPIVQGTSYHCEFNLFYDPENPSELNRIKGLSTSAVQNLMAKGAFFSRPYGESAGMILNRDAASVAVINKFKKIFDPNNVMNPGKVGF